MRTIFGWAETNGSFFLVSVLWTLSGIGHLRECAGFPWDRVRYPGPAVGSTRNISLFPEVFRGFPVASPCFPVGTALAAAARSRCTCSVYRLPGLAASRLPGPPGDWPARRPPRSRPVRGSARRTTGCSTPFDAWLEYGAAPVKANVAARRETLDGDPAL
ncbi:hypothetical protein WME89_34710 [Sorangium sp. So ce321]|uniref:hypothetical protein n=1 Tax=Sorangium sp. So ce321 TaxID=3133300 RepID=UPI003F5DDDEF